MHVTAVGRGPNIVLLHGWGMHAGVVAGLAHALCAFGRVHVPDLPGHGHSSGCVPPDIFGVVDELRGAVPADAIWAGWSLGATLALLAADPARARGLILLSGTPRFLATAGWSHGVDAAAFESVRVAARQNPSAGVTALLRLFSVGGEGARRTRRELERRLRDRPMASPGGLARGLELLETADLRKSLEHWHLPSLLIGGARDPLVPPAALEWCAGALPDGRVHVLPGAGHAPFISHPSATVAEIESFLASRFAEGW